MIPDYQSLIIPFLRHLADEEEHKFRELVEVLAAEYKVTAKERDELLPSNQAVFEYRVGCVRTHLKRAGYVNSPKQATFVITELGLQLLKQTSQYNDANYEERFHGLLQSENIINNNIEMEEETIIQNPSEKRLEENQNGSSYEEIKLDDEKDEEEQDDLSGKRKIYTDQGDPEVDSLHKRFTKGRLNVQPVFQRQFVWDKVKSSRLIESALLDIPIPIIYLSEEKDGKENVIDGQQRLTAFFSFIDGKLPDNSEFKLSGLKVFTELNGKKFKELSEELQDKITTYKIRAIKFKKESDSDLQFEIFARLNTGSVPLNDQELRNCVFRGKFNELIKELSQDKDFKYLLGIATPDRRMKDRELVLRFAAFHFNTYLNYYAPIKKYLNDTMGKYQNIGSDDEVKFRNAFKNTVSIILSLLDTNAFKRYYRGDEKNKNGRWETQKFNVSLFDILMYSFAREDKNTVFQNLDRIREALIDLMTTDQDFIDSIELSTSSKKAVTIRFDKWRFALQEILGIGIKEPRCFTYSLKQELYKVNDTCAICGNKIVNLDDAAVDHIKQYWTGGKTIPENARLAHRYCNNARPRIEVSEDTVVS